jgi:uncharacterized membrane protein
MSQYLAEERIKKAIVWRLCSVAITLLSTYLYTESITGAFFFTMFLQFMLIVGHYIFETLWERFA